MLYLTATQVMEFICISIPPRDGIPCTLFYYGGQRSGTRANLQATPTSFLIMMGVISLPHLSLVQANIDGKVTGFYNTRSIFDVLEIEILLGDHIFI